MCERIQCRNTTELFFKPAPTNIVLRPIVLAITFNNNSNSNNNGNRNGVRFTLFFLCCCLVVFVFFAFVGRNCRNREVYRHRRNGDTLNLARTQPYAQPANWNAWQRPELIHRTHFVALHAASESPSWRYTAHTRERMPYVQVCAWPVFVCINSHYVFRSIRCDGRSRGFALTCTVYVDFIFPVSLHFFFLLVVRFVRTSAMCKKLHRMRWKMCTKRPQSF